VTRGEANRRQASLGVEESEKDGWQEVEATDAGAEGGSEGTRTSRRTTVPKPGRQHGGRPQEQVRQSSGEEGHVEEKRVKKTASKPVLLAGGNPQIARADGDAPVQAYIAAMPGWKRDLGKRLDALIVRNVPNVRKAVKWNSPFYGIEGQGWFLNFHCFTNYVKVAFFRGTSLRPLPPGKSKHEEVRYLDIHEDDELDEKLVTSWIRQTAKLPGWTP
jgi:hypothetical protein